MLRNNKSVYLRLSLTPECNLRCQYCRPASSIGSKPEKKNLSNNKLLELVNVINSEAPIRKLRFTGGEPLLRSGLTSLIASFKELLPTAKLCLTTNGVMLERYVKGIRSAGVEYLNISLDTTDEERFYRLTRGGRLSKTIKGIEEASKAGFEKLKLNTVLLKSYNYTELIKLISIAAKFDCEIRFVELMPIGQGAFLFRREFVSADDALSLITNRFPYIRPLKSTSTAQRHLIDVNGKEVTIGFIASITHRFCDSCDRLRLDSFGSLYPCLRKDCAIDLAADLESADHEAIRDKVRLAIDDRSGSTDLWPERPMVNLGG